MTCGYDQLPGVESSRDFRSRASCLLREAVKLAHSTRVR